MSDFETSAEGTPGEPGGLRIQDTIASGGRCLNCDRSFGHAPACQFCGQMESLPVGIVLSSAARRFGGHLLSALLALVTLGIGYLIWALIVYNRGQTPAKQLLGMRVVKLRTGRRASWGTMFLRDWICMPVVTIVSAVLLYIPFFWLLWDKRNQELWDKMAGTIVVNDSAGLV